jgi:putative SOS response-associated peptidase YedK
MCGRYTITTTAEALAERFHATLAPGVAMTPSYNAAPTQKLPVILSDHPEQITVAPWGYLLEGVRDTGVVKPLINARAETVAQSPLFKPAFSARRCLVLADGFYEWKRVGGRSVPYRFVLTTEEPFAMAGIWSRSILASGTVHTSFAILTTEPNTVVRPIHDRMPVILRAEDEEDWLNSQLSLEEAQSLLVPYPAEKLTAYEVSSQVNFPRYNRPEAVQPVRNVI